MSLVRRPGPAARTGHLRCSDAGGPTPFGVARFRCLDALLAEGA